MRLKDKVAVITGASSGIGRASAQLFAKEGAKVVVAARRSKEGQETVNLVKEEGGEAIFVETDVAKVGDNERLIRTAVNTYGKLNILFNNAGTPGPTGLEGVTEKEYDECMNVITKGPFFACQFAVPEMRKAGGGSILFTATVGALVALKISLPVYQIGKAGLILMTKALARLLARDNIRVNCLCPGTFDTPQLQGIFNTPGFLTDPLDIHEPPVVPLGRLGRPEELAYPALFLVSDEASYITGATLVVDGGDIA